eukprot:GDKI01038326.1.p1 GENE.GDKI01038326.1~~GDKI01038326.1.p1  ORF type:complete len:114 (+),score=27.42 GDKI01038326.1:178-519(+)
MVAEIALALQKLDLRDSRIVYQLVHWVDSRGQELRADQMLTIAEVFANMHIAHVGAWKALGTRCQKRGCDLSLKEIKRLYKAFQNAGMGNQRVFGMLDHFIQLKADMQQFGPA